MKEIIPLKMLPLLCTRLAERRSPFFLWVLLIFFLLPGSFASPGGISQNLTLWLNAKNTSTLYQDSCGGTPSTSDGDRIGCWQDSSGNSRDFTASGNIRPTLKTSARTINFNPSLLFDGTEDYLDDADGEDYINGINEFSTFVVVDSDVAAGDRYIFNSENDVGNREAPWGLRFDDAGVLSGQDDTFKTGINTGSPTLYEGNESGITSANPLLASVHWASGEVPTLYVDGRNIALHSLTTKSGNLSGADYARIGHQAGHSYWDGTIAELVFYHERLSTLQQQKVESYLAIKYGITLENTTDYIDSSQTVFWSAASHTSYSHDIAGIAKDNASNLDQNKSISSNPDAVVTISAEEVLDDSEALMWGNNNATNTWTSDGAPSGYKILSRVWETQETGEAGNITLFVAVENTNYDIPSLSYGSSFYLIYDTDNDNSLSDEEPIVLYDDGSHGDETSSDNVWSIHATNLGNNTLFSFATQVTPYPGGVDGVQLWLKGNAGVNHSSGNVTSWEDQAGSNTMTSFDNPQTNQTEINFNNVVELDGTDDYFDGGTIIGMREVFLVSDADNDGPLLTVNESIPSSTQQYWLRVISDKAYMGDSDPDYIHSDSSIPQSMVIYNHEMVGGSAGTDSRIVLNGENQSVTSISSNDPLNSFSNRPRIGKSTDPSFTTEFQGLIGEIVVYNRSLNDTERNKVHSYLAVKYGITLHNSLDYIDSLENVIFASTTTHENYTNNIAGIGKDDGSLLNQTESKSVHSESIVHINDSTGLQHSEFLLWGHDNGSLSTTATNTPMGKDVLQRTWRVDQTGDVGTVDLMMNISSMTLLSTNHSHLFLLKNTNSSFTDIVGSKANSSNGSIVAFPDVDFGSNDFFTLAVTDVVYPSISFTTPTQPNGTVLIRDYIELNVSIVENHLANLTYRLYNTTFQLVNETVLASASTINFTGLARGNYYYNATACDQNNQCNTTETRIIELDQVPQVTDIYPSGHIFNTSINITVNASVSDNSVHTVLANISYPNSTTELLTLSLSGIVYSANFTIPSFAGVYNVTIIANDTNGNINNSEQAVFLVQLVNPNDINTILAWYDGADNATLFTDSSCQTKVSSDNQEVLCWENKAEGSNATVVSGKSGARYRSIPTEKISSQTTLRFNKSNETVYGTGVDIRANTSEDITLFAVYRPRTTNTSDQGQALWGNDDGSWDRFYYSLFTESGSLGTDGIDDGLISLGGASQGLSIDGAGIVDTVFLLTAVYDGNVSSGTNSGPVNASQIYFDGNLKTIFTDESHATAAQTQLFLGRDGDNGHYDGDLAEVIVYDRVLTLCQIELVNNYLGEKYGKDFSGIGNNYGFSSPHNHSINGISEYVGNCSVSTEVTSAQSSIATISNPSSLDVNDSLTFAHNNGGFLLIADVPDNYTRRLTQSWRVDVDNTPGNVSVSFDLSTTGINVSAVDFALLIDSDTSFNDSTVYTTGFSLSGSVVTFTEVNFSNGDYFTLAVNEPFPSIFFVTPTLSNGTSHPQNNMTINVSSASIGSDHYTFVNFDDTLTLWLRFDDVNASGDPVDLSKNAMNGSLQSGAAINITGKFGDALHLDGTDDYVDLADMSSDFSSGLTICAWTYFDSFTASWPRIVDFGQGQADDNILFARHGTTSDLTFEVYSGGSGGGQVTATGVLSTGAWQHLCAAEDSSGSVRLYVDSVNVVNGSTAVPVSLTRTNNYIGRSNWGSDGYFDGAIDDLFVFNRSLNYSEVLSLYNASKIQYENTFSGLSEGNHSFIGYAVSETGQKNQTELRTVTIDATAPSISYAGGTAKNNSVVLVDFVFVNVSISDNNPQNTTFRLYNSSFDLMNTSAFSSVVTSLNFTSLSDGVYYYNVTVFDSAGNSDTAETRKITVDTTPPSIFFNNPPTPNNESYVSDNYFQVSINSSDDDTSHHYTFLDFESSLVFWMRMDDVNASGHPTDISGYGNNGTLINNPVINSSGVFGDGIHFDGVDDFINVSDDPSLKLGIGEFTLAAWFNLRGYKNDDQQILVKRVSGGGDYEIQIEETKRIKAYLGNGSSSSIDSSFNVSLNRWYHTVVTRRNGTFFLYVDGVLENQSAFSGNVSSTAPLQIGNDPAKPTEFFNGSIDEVLIFNRSFNANEVFALYNATATQYQNNFTSLPEGDVSFTGHTVSSHGDKNQTELRTVTIDTLPPAISYTGGTLANNSFVNQNFVYVNVSVMEINEKNITFRLFNSSFGSLNETLYTTAQREINFTSLTDGVYYYNVTVFDLAGNSNTTETRAITLDTMAPAVSIVSPQETTNPIESSITISANVTDAVSVDSVLANVSYPNGTIDQLTLSLASGNIYSTSYAVPSLTGAYIITFIANDTMGNINASEVANFTARNQSVPSIFFITPPTPVSGENLSEDYFFISINSSDTDTNDHYTFVDFDDTLTLWMRFDDVNASGDPVDISGRGNNGSLIGNALINSTGRFGNAAHFDGDGDFVDLPASNVLIPNGNVSWTMSTWFNAKNIGSSDFSNRIITVRNAATLSAISFTLGGSNKLQFFYRDGGGTGTTIDVRTISTNAWYHYAVSYNGSEFLLYVNGVLNHTISDSMAQTSSHTARIGANPAGSSEFFNGSIDEMLLFDRSLSSGEILSLYNATATQYGNNFTSLSEGNHSFIGYAVSTNGNKNQTELRTVTIDTTPPQISYAGGTLANNSFVDADYVFVNVSVADAHLQNTTFKLYNSSFGLINTSSFGTVVTSLNFTSLANGVYYYNVTVFDSAGNSNATETRKITLDSIGPSIVSLSTSPSTSFNLTALFEISANVTDAHGVSVVLANITLPNGSVNQITLSKSTGNHYNNSFTAQGIFGTHTVRIIANDTVGNVNSSETTTFEVQNDVPDPSGVSLNGGTDITVSSGANTTVIGTATISDLNGYTDISSVTGYLFFTDAGVGIADNNSKHYTSGCASNSDGSGNTVSYNCSFNVSHYAIPTDAGSNQSASNWTFRIAPLDSQGTGTNGSAVVDLNTLAAFTISPTVVNFGELGLGANTTNLNQQVNVTNLGNVGLDILLSGTNLSCNVSSISVSFLEYNSTPFSYGSGTDLLESDVELDLDSSAGTEQEPEPLQTTYYGLGIPAIAVGGSCNGSIIISGQSDPHND